MQQIGIGLLKFASCEDKMSSIKKEKINTTVIFWEVCDTKHFFFKIWESKGFPRNIINKKKT